MLKDSSFEQTFFMMNLIFSILEIIYLLIVE